MKIPPALAAIGLALACVSGVARADVSATVQRASGARTSASMAPASERSPRSPDATTEDAPAAAGWLTPANACLVLAVIGALALLGRRRGFD